MYPAVPPPKHLVGRAVDFKLKPGWRYDEAMRVFVDDKGVESAALGLPKKSRVVYKIPSLARSASKGLSKAERDLQRYMQLIVPARPSKELLKRIQSWPWVEEAHLSPEISLPTDISTPNKRQRK
jgi:hypothetical protein